MKFLSYVLFWFLVFFVFIFLGTGDGDQNINQEGYFKLNQNRIFSFSFDENVPKKAIKDQKVFINGLKIIFLKYIVI